MALRRGFKTEANRTSREVRAELGLAADAPLCPFLTASHLDVRVIKLSAFEKEQPNAVRYLCSMAGQEEFSAITICIGTVRLIVFNDGHSPARCAANIMHELAHLLLMHPPHPVCGDTGKRHFDAAIEEEANWFGPALLVSDEAALTVAKRQLPIKSAAAEYGVSASLMQMRLNVTGAQRRISKAA
jgi:hypothetical protein